MISLVKKVEVPVDAEGTSYHVFIDLEDVPPTGVVVFTAKVRLDMPYLRDTSPGILQKTVHDTPTSAWAVIQSASDRFTDPNYNLRRSTLLFSLSRAKDVSGRTYLELHGVSFVLKESKSRKVVAFSRRFDGF